MGLFSGKKTEPVVRNPRPKGAQKGVTKRVHERGPLVSPRSTTRTPWLSSGKASDGYAGGRAPRWREK